MQLQYDISQTTVDERCAALQKKVMALQEEVAAKQEEVEHLRKQLANKTCIAL